MMPNYVFGILKKIIILQMIDIIQDVIKKTKETDFLGILPLAVEK